MGVKVLQGEEIGGILLFLIELLGEVIGETHLWESNKWPGC